MALPLYLAMTREEFHTNPLPALPAYMACHFSAYGKGLQDLPQTLPEGSMLILDDRIPLWDHDPRLVTRQLEEALSRFDRPSLLLDFQRPNQALAEEIIAVISQAITIPWAVTEHYAAGIDCAVLVATPPPNKPLRAERWDGRECWLEVAAETIQYTVTKECSAAKPLQDFAGAFLHRDERLCCSYRVDVEEDHAKFTIGRTREDLQKLMAQAESMGFTRAVGLYQQLGEWE